MDAQTSLQIRRTLAWEQFPDEVVAVDLDRLLYFNLTGGGADLFRCFVAPATLARVVAHLGPSFDATRDALAAAASTLVDQLVTEKLFVVAAAAAAPPDAPLPGPHAGEPKRTLAELELHVHGDLQNLLILDPVHDAANEGWPAPRKTEPEP